MSPRPLLASCVAVALSALVAVPLGARLTADELRRLIATGAELQIGVTTEYDPQYRRLPYPGGDVSPETGVCADVVVRAMRRIGIDLQVELHEDMKRNFALYPRRWGMSRPDPSIDHRRVPNLMVFFRRKGKALPAGTSYQPGDIVAWRLGNGLHHIGVVANYRSAAGKPLIVHNIGRGTRVEDVLGRFPQIGHYRW